MKENKPNECIRISGREVTRKDMARYATTFKFRCITERYISRNLYELIRGILPGCENRRDSIEKVEDFYREHILSYCYDELQIRYRDKLELNIVEALRKEADYKNRDRDEYVREKIEDLFHLASPFVPKVSHHRELQYWGIHPSLKKELQEELMQEMFKEKIQ